MKTVLKLSLAHLREHPLRLALTSLATAAAAAMVIWVVSGYDALLRTFDEYANLALGRYELSVAPISHFSQVAPGAIPSPAQKDVPAKALALLLSDPRVSVVDPMWARQVPVTATDPARVQAVYRSFPDTVVGTEADSPPFELAAGQWLNVAAPDGAEAVASESAAAACGLKLGDELLLGSGARETRVRIVGLVKSPDVSGWSATVAKMQMMTPGVGGLFVSTNLLERASGEVRRISFIGVGFKPGADLTAFRFQWSPRLSALPTPCQFQEAHDIEEALDESASAENLEFQGHMAAAVSMVAAFFIIFSTLNMGVTERTRQLAVLRAVALTRSQIAMLVVVEALILGATGFIVGTTAGWLILKVAAVSAPELREDGAVVGGLSILMAGICAFGGALLASVWPAVRAMRVRPLDAMGKLAQSSNPRLRPFPFATGLLLMAVYPALAHIIPHADDAPFVFYMLAGILSLAAGIILCAPAVVMLVDRGLGPFLARLLGIPSRLLLSQITSNLPRTISTAIALTVGLGLLIGIQVWGHTMLGGFVPGSWAPDAMIAFRPDGIDATQAARVRSWKGVAKALPMVVEQPRLKEDLTHSAVRATVVRQDSVVMVGIDPQEAFGGLTPLIHFDWVEGDRDQAITQIKQGRGCLVPDHFLRESGLRIGDKFELVPPESPGTPVAYTIAGSVKMPGWHWQTKPTGMRTRTHRAAALVFANYTTVASDFQFRAASYVWLNRDPAQISDAALETASQKLLSETTGKHVVVGEAAPGQAYVQVHPVDGIREIVHAHSRQWLWVMSRLPVVILLITTVGVFNTLLASVHARRWDFGILRAVGFTRGTLVRLVIAEGILIGLVAGTLSLVFGIVSGWCGAGISRYISFFGGMNTSLVVPWPDVLWSLAAVSVLACVAAIWPAVSIGRTKPLELLQQGRARF
ncbi:MAG: FtsX-like permease family protein [Verrucomicrobium sp.]